MLTDSWDWARHGNARRGRANIALTWKSSSSSISSIAPKNYYPTQVEELPLFPSAGDLQNANGTSGLEVCQCFFLENSHSLNKVHKKEGKKKTKISHWSHRKISPTFPSKQKHKKAWLIRSKLQMVAGKPSAMHGGAAGDAWEAVVE